MIVKDLISLLKTVEPQAQVNIASDEEWNMLFQEFEVAINEEDNSIVLFGLSGTEKPL